MVFFPSFWEVGGGGGGEGRGENWLENESIE